MKHPILVLLLYPIVKDCLPVAGRLRCSSSQGRKRLYDHNPTVNI